MLLTPHHAQGSSTHNEKLLSWQHPIPVQQEGDSAGLGQLCSLGPVHTHSHTHNLNHMLQQGGGIAPLGTKILPPAQGNKKL